MPRPSSVRRLVVLIAGAAGLAVLGCAHAAGPATAPPPAAASSTAHDADGLARRAAGVTIVRDDWGIPHVHGRTDADAVFGVIYAQAEDDFHRIEMNYLDALGRRAEAEGERAVFRDLRQRLFITPDSLQAEYRRSPAWLQALVQGWADGLNWFLRTHPDVKPLVLTRFEPWMALAFTEGSIGGDIERIDLRQLQAFYEGNARREVSALAPLRTGVPPEPTGSNGIAVAPSRTATGHAMLLINPHTSFFFRAEAQMTSDEGLDAYGALTWGQFFIYQGFNAHVGWMHTSSGNDAVDEWKETVRPVGDGWVYKYGGTERPVQRSTVTLQVRTARGLEPRTFTVYRTHHGPVIRIADGKWITIGLMQKHVPALMQSYLRTKATDFAGFKRVTELQANSSNNTIYADANGTIAYFHPSFIPKRDPRFEWNRPVDGSDPAADWQGLHGYDDSPHLVNPTNGWIQNTNNWPYSAAGANSPKRADFPKYMDWVGENPRGIHAMEVLTLAAPFTLESFMHAAYDPHLIAFEPLVPALLRDYDALAGDDPLKARLAEPIGLLRGWDRRWSAASVPTTVAVFWGDELWRRAQADEGREDTPIYDYMATGVPPALRLQALAAALDTLAARYGSWRTPWGDVNRFQRLTGDIVQPFDDRGPSIAVPFASARWGSLASFGTVTPTGTTKLYGTSGNSFVAVVEFGPRVSARAVSAGGESGHPGNRHFDDQAQRYADGNLRPVYFHAEQLAGHTEKTYHPGL